MILATLMILSMSCIYLPLQHLNPVILREYLHLADGNSIESCQPFRLGHPFTDKYGVQVFFDRIGVNTVVNFGQILTVVSICFCLDITKLFISA